jgi:osmotically-inducible protein OsmY
MAVFSTSSQRTCSACEHSGESSLLGLAANTLVQTLQSKPIRGSALSSIHEHEVPMHRIPLTVSFLLLGVLACRDQMVRADSLENSGVTVDPSSSPSDVAIRTSIEEALVKNRLIELQSGDVQIHAVSGVVTLQGRVNQVDAKERIYALALHTPGVTRVIDELGAPITNPSTASDDATTQAIQKRLAERQADNVKVTTVHANVTLEGSVLTETEKGEIQKMVAEAPNVAAVDNRLSVRPLTKL